MPHRETSLAQAAAAPRMVRVCKTEIALGGPLLGELRDANALLDDVAALRERLAEDGYLLLRGIIPRDVVLASRRALLERLAADGQLDPAAPLMDAVAAPAPRPPRTQGDRVLTRLPAFLRVVEGPEIMGVHTRLLGEPAITFDFKWLRVVPAGGFTGAHMDVVYMGRGCVDRLRTTWIPHGDVPIEQGPIALLPGSHRAPALARVRETYGRMDVDRDRVDGWFSSDAVDTATRFGMRWATADFRAGDVLVFGMHLMHASLTNVSDRLRLTSDTRYQPASEPIDERWVGAQPMGHARPQDAGPRQSVEDLRRRWGV